MGDIIHAHFQHEFFSSICLSVIFDITDYFLGKIDNNHLCSVGYWDLVKTNSFKDGFRSYYFALVTTK
jgi:hypothetical protein